THPLDRSARLGPTSRTIAMSPSPHTTRREILAAGAAALGARATVPAGATTDRADPGDWAAESQRLPEPKIVLPTDALPAPEGPKKRIAAITTAYFRYSHADDIITRFIEGYAIVGRTHRPHCEVVSLAIEQFPA